MLELLLTINTIIFSSAPTWLRGKRKQGELDQNATIVAGLSLKHATERAGHSC